MKPIKAAIIGAGNVAWHLSQALENAGYPICEVYSRTAAHAVELAERMYGATVNPDLDFSESEARLFFLTIKDDALEQVASQISFPPDSIVVHTSGSKSLEELRQSVFFDTVNTGVFYPLQTFSKSKKVDFSTVPICIEACNEEVEHILVEIGQSISQIVYVVNSDERRVLHVAAVFACNFTNHLFALSKDILEKENLEFELLKPLIWETVEKALQADHPANVQTGPAKRNDQKIIDQQINYLENNPEAQTIYQLLTESILARKLAE